MNIRRKAIGIFLAAVLLPQAVLAGCSSAVRNLQEYREVQQVEETETPDGTPAETAAPQDAPAEEADAGDSAPDETTYNNAEFGFVLKLPESWRGYTIVLDEWEGVALEGDREGEATESGPILIVRHPQWTAEHPLQDIPIMVLTLGQWAALEEGRFHIGAAPAGPTELDRNNRYVFVLPARYNYAFPDGYEEVEEILAGDPLQAYSVDPS